MNRRNFIQKALFGIGALVAGGSVVESTKPEVKMLKTGNECIATFHNTGKETISLGGEMVIPPFETIVVVSDGNEWKIEKDETERLKKLKEMRDATYEAHFSGKRPIDMKGGIYKYI